MNKFGRFIQLSRLEKRLLFQALLLLPLAALALRLWGFRRLHSRLDRGSRIPSPLTPTLAPFGGEGGEQRWVREPLNQQLFVQAMATAKMVRLAAQYGPYRANCLKQSLVIWWHLQRHGVESALRIGVRKEAARLEAHAWVECLGQPLGEGADIRERFKPFDQILSQDMNWT